MGEAWLSVRAPPTEPEFWTNTPVCQSFPWAWAKARPGLTARLLAHPRLGPALYAYLCHGAIARAAKRAAIGGMTLSLGLSALLLSPPPALIAVLAGGWALGCLWIATRREGPDSAAVHA